MKDLPAPVLLYDGGCGLCSRLVQLVLRIDRKGALRFASLQGEFARELRARHPELEGVDSVAWVILKPAEQVLIRSEAALRLTNYLGFPWRMLTLIRLIPRPIRDRLYDWFARRRHRWFGHAPDCSLTGTEHSHRMLSS